MVYQSGKANIVADIPLRNRPNTTKSEESAQHKQQMDQDAERQCDQGFAITSSVSVDESVLVAFKNVQ